MLYPVMYVPDQTSVECTESNESSRLCTGRFALKSSHANVYEVSSSTEDINEKSSQSSANNMGILTLWFILLNILLQVPISNQGILIHKPKSINTINECLEVFSCTGIGDLITYTINGTLADQSPLPITLGSSLVTNDDEITRDLTIEATTEYSVLIIVCLVVNGSGDDFTVVRSLDALLMVESKLAEPENLHQSSIDSSTVNISWSPPITTLPGIDITGYNISVTSTNGNSTNYFTSNTYYELPLTDITNELLLTDITNSSCNEINITVSAQTCNKVNGENSSIYLMRDPQRQIPTRIFISGTNFHVVINVSNFCPGERPTAIFVEIYNKGMLISKTDWITLYSSSNDDQLIANFPLSLPTQDSINYTAVVTFKNLNYTFNVTSNVTSIQNVSISVPIGTSVPPMASSQILVDVMPLPSTSSMSITTTSPTIVETDDSQSESTLTTTGIIILVVGIICVVLLIIIIVAIAIGFNLHKWYRKKNVSPAPAIVSEK